MEQHSDTFLDNASEALKNSGQAERRDRIALFASQIRTAASDSFEDDDDLRHNVKKIRQHSLDNLD